MATKRVTTTKKATSSKSRSTAKNETASPLLAKLVIDMENMRADLGLIRQALQGILPDLDDREEETVAVATSRPEAIRSTSPQPEVEVNDLDVEDEDLND